MRQGRMLSNKVSIPASLRKATRDIDQRWQDKQRNKIGQAVRQRALHLTGEQVGMQIAFRWPSP